ncbi:MAG: hypothetical protein CVT73_23045 [Alphaproteobacteria bacterium HGW-Alphaproteobacteria-12]|nr:MAG: hypothetical protein CVT73_23045 [Alphaproteobacteria bacterium HGW-Alphaproteobacteria-12]
MGRKKGYVESEALEKAMLLFWQHGYAAIGMRQLADEMGINPFSLYASFESKEALFARALDHYLETFIKGRMIRPLAVPAPNLASLRGFLETFAATDDGTHPPGCFICNTMADATSPAPEVQAVIDRYQRLLEGAFSALLRTEYPLADPRDIQARTALLLCLVIGISVRKRNGFEGRPAQVVVDEIMALTRLG